MGLLVLQGAGLMATALGVGLALAGPRQAGASRVAYLGTAALAGLLLLAAGLHLFSLLDLPPWLLFWLSWTGAALGFWHHFKRHPRLEAASCWWEGGLLAGLLFFTGSAFLLALSGPSLAYDTLGCWWPGALEVVRHGAASPLGTHPYQLHPEYPRGLAWLFALGGGGGEPEAAFLRLVTFFFWPLSLLTLVDLGRRLQKLLPACLAALLYLLLPELPALSTSGLADVPLAAAVLLAGLALSLPQEEPAAWRLSVVAALGALSIKDEGSVVYLAMTALLGWRLFRARFKGPGLRVAPWLVLGLWGLHWRSAGAASALGGLGPAFQEPAFLLGRLQVFPGLLWQALQKHGRLIWQALQEGRGEPWLAVMLVLFSVLVLLPRGRRGVVILPAALLLLAEMAALILTPLAPMLQLETALPRLVLQSLPLLLFASFERLLGGLPSALLETP